MEPSGTKTRHPGLFKTNSKFYVPYPWGENVSVSDSDYTSSEDTPVANGEDAKSRRKWWRKRSTKSADHGNLSEESGISVDMDNPECVSLLSMSTTDFPTDDPLGDQNEDEFDGWPSDEFTSEEDDPEISEAETARIREEKRAHVANEVMTSEETYTNRLFTILRTSFMVDGANKVKHILPANFRTQMFPHIDTLYRLHNDSFLPAIKNRLCEWDSRPYFADVWKKYLPYLSTYKMYAQHYSGASDLITKYRQTSSDFTGLLAKCEAAEEFCRLSLQNLLLEPIQRLPRYRLLLQTYSKYLNKETQGEERENIEEVIESLGQTINDCEKILKEKDMFGDFLKIQDRLEDLLSVINPQTKLLKEGSCMEVTTTSKKPIKRHLFLFSDFLLICSRRLMSEKFTIMKRLEMYDMKIRPAKQLVGQGYTLQTTILLKGGEKVVTLFFEEEQNKNDWEDMFTYAICVRLKVKMEHQNSVDSIIEHDNCTNFVIAPLSLNIHKAYHVDRCMACKSKFVPILRRRRKCKGCAIDVCHKCCSHKMFLPHKQNTICKVCDNCFVRARRDCPELTRRISSIINIETSDTGGNDVTLERTSRSRVSILPPEDTIERESCSQEGENCNCSDDESTSVDTITICDDEP